jgi:hypothetical protein
MLSTNRHKQNESRAKTREETRVRQAQLPFVEAAPRGAPDAALQEKLNRALDDSLKLTEALAVASGVSPSVLSSLLAKKAPFMRGLTLITASARAIGSADSIARHLEDAEVLLDAKLRSVLTGKFGCIVTDGATFRRDKVVVVMFTTGALPHPVLLGLIFPSDDEDNMLTYDAAAGAVDIRSVAARFGIDIAKNAPALAGDNVNYNNALAAELGVARAKCIPHALHLLIKKGVAHLPLFKKLVITASGIIYAGGTSRRAAELRSEYGLAVHRLIAYTNRFGSTIEAARYRLDNFDDIKRWLNTSELLLVRKRVR